MFLKYPISDRVRLLLEEKNTDFVYYLLAKHTGKSVEELKDLYKIELHAVRQELTIEGEMTKVAELFFYCNGLGVNFDSVTNTSLRCSVHSFLGKVR